jgi:hypothetical protein
MVTQTLHSLQARGRSGRCAEHAQGSSSSCSVSAPSEPRKEWKVVITDHQSTGRPEQRSRTQVLIADVRIRQHPDLRGQWEIRQPTVGRGHIGGTWRRDLLRSSENRRDLNRRSGAMLGVSVLVTSAYAQDPAYRPTLDRYNMTTL